METAWGLTGIVAVAVMKDVVVQRAAAGDATMVIAVEDVDFAEKDALKLLDHIDLKDMGRDHPLDCSFEACRTKVPAAVMNAVASMVRRLRHNY